jgi:Sec-independent protein translocase protein TatA
MSDVESFFGKLKELASSLGDAHAKAQEASEEADRFGGEWQQELSTDLDDVTVRIRDLISDLETIMREGRTLLDDYDVEEKRLREGKSDEELAHEEVEKVQDDIEEREWRKEKEKK